MTNSDFQTPPRSPRDFLVDLDLVSIGCGVGRDTPRTWRTRGILPPPDMPQIKDRSLWWASTLALWAHSTGRPWDWGRVSHAAGKVAGEQGGKSTPVEEWGQMSIARGGFYPARPVSFDWLGPEAKASVAEVLARVEAARKPQGGLAKLACLL